MSFTFMKRRPAMVEVNHPNVIKIFARITTIHSVFLLDRGRFIIINMIALANSCGK